MKLKRIEKKVYALAEKWVGEKHIPSIIRGLNQAFKPYIVCFSSGRFEDLYYPDHNVIVGGHYCNRISDIVPEHIYIQLNFPKDSKKAIISEEGAKNLAKAMYYGNPDELDAHAYETQAEKLDINKLRKAHKIGWRECEAIFMYRLHFRKQDPKVWQRFLKKVYKNNDC